MSQYYVLHKAWRRFRPIMSAHMTRGKLSRMLPWRLDQVHKYDQLQMQATGNIDKLNQKLARKIGNTFTVGLQKPAVVKRHVSWVVPIIKQVVFRCSRFCCCWSSDFLVCSNHNGFVYDPCAIFTCGTSAAFCQCPSAAKYPSSRAEVCYA